MNEEVEATSLGTEFWQDLQACNTGGHAQNVKVQVKFHEAMAALMASLNLAEGPFLLCSVHRPVRHCNMGPLHTGLYNV